MSTPAPAEVTAAPLSERPTDPPAPTTLQPGLWIQVYDDAIHNHDEVPAKLDTFQAAGVTGVVRHRFPTSGAGWIGPLIKPIRDRGMLVGASEGLDTSQRNGEQKGKSLRSLADCGIDLLGQDAEPHWDPGTPQIIAEVAAMEAQLVGVTCATIDQPWPGRGHPHFPLAPFGRAVKVRAPQWYQEANKRYMGVRRFQEWLGWAEFWDFMEGDYVTPAVAAKLTRMGYVPFAPDAIKPRIVTMEGYDTYGDVMPDLVAALCSEPTVVAWCEPWPGAAFMRGWAARRYLHARGFLAADCSDGAFTWNAAGQMVSGAVKRFQIDAKLDVDGRCGKFTLAAMGL